MNGICMQGGCLNGGKQPPAGCTSGADLSGAKWVVCKADCATAWLSHATVGGGQFHAKKICNDLGYATLGKWDGNYGTICGTNQGAGSCANPQTSMFSRDPLAPNCGSDANGGIFCNTVEWQCLK